MVRKQEMGAPLPFGRAMKPDMVVADAGDFEKGDGLRVVLSDTSLVFMGSFEGMNITLGIDIHTLLEAIQAHTRNHES